MPDLSDEQSWWTQLLGGSADSAWTMPEQSWDAALAAALDPDTPMPDDALIPSDDADAPVDLTAGDVAVEPTDTLEMGEHDGIGSYVHHHDWLHQVDDHHGDDFDGAV